MPARKSTKPVSLSLPNRQYLPPTGNIYQLPAIFAGLEFANTPASPLSRPLISNNAPARARSTIYTILPHVSVILHPTSHVAGGHGGCYPQTGVRMGLVYSHSSCPREGRFSRSLSKTLASLPFSLKVIPGD